MTETNKNQPPIPPDSKSDQWRQIARYSGLGMEMAIAIVGMALLGHFIDGRMQLSQPIFTLTLSGIGLVYVFVKIFKIAGDDQK